MLKIFWKNINKPENTLRGKRTARLASGFTLIEALVAVFVFLVVAGSILEAYYVLINSAKTSRLKISATFIANEQIEIARNLPYADVGVVGGIPSGLLEPDTIIQKDAATFNVKTTVRNKDDSFDGTLGGTPNDFSPADYKLVEVSISCNTCKNLSPVVLTTTISPKSLESTSNNGAIFVNVFDALGQPIEGADVEIVNSSVSPSVNLSDVSGIGGSLQLVDVIPSNQSYQISVSKSGYSSDLTYPSGDPLNPNPTKPHATVAPKEVTQISFSIDELSSLDASTLTSTCTSTPNIGFGLRGSKLIGIDPDIYKYDSYHVTGSDANKSVQGLEWDTYSISVPVTSTSTHFMAGTLPLSPLVLLPGSNQNVKIIVKPKNPNGLLVSIKDSGTGLPITGAEVTLRNGGVVDTITTGRGSQIQSDWSGGPGQIDMFEEDKYFSGLNIEDNDPSGEIKLSEILGEYESDGYLESSAFDTGSAGNFYNINWIPVDQPESTGVKFQIATNNDKTTWNYVGPDGTSGTYFTSSGETLGSYHEDNRYMRYKAFLNTSASTSTPNISSVSFGFTSDCVPSGQVFFDGLSQGDYEIDVSKAGYNSVVAEPVSVSGAWQDKTVLMSVE